MFFKYKSNQSYFLHLSWNQPKYHLAWILIFVDVFSVLKEAQNVLSNEINENVRLLQHCTGV